MIWAWVGRPTWVFPGETEEQVLAASAVPLLQCGGGALRALLGSAGPGWAWFALLLHPVGYCCLVVEIVHSRVPLCR